MRIELPSGTPAELALPAGPPTRGVVLHPDIGGLRPLFDEMCARLAEENAWAVCAPEPFPGRQHMNLEERLASVSRLDDGVQLGHLTAAADRLEVEGAEVVAVMGFCMGGMYALKAAATGRFDRVVAFYGMIRVPEQWRSPGQGEPLDVVRASSTPVLAVIGTDDQWTPPGDVEDLAEAGATVIRYEGAEHGFVHDPERPAHRPDDAADAWRRVVEFLAAVGS